MKPSTECLEASQVDSLLLGNLTPEEYQAVQDHLESCETCRTRVETTIGPEQWWSDVQSVLRSHSSLHAAASLRAAGGFRVEEVNADAASLGETRLRESVLDLLGPTDDPNMLGRIGSYEIIGLLGQGGMGAVFKGFDRSLNRFVAIKMLLPHLAASGAARKRFAREGQAVAAVVDDHVMAIHCVDEWRGVPYLVMTYSRGCSLQKRLSGSGPLKVREILRIGMQAARGLAAAHAQGIVHRDIKPANIFLDQNVERVQLMDFGLARAVDDASLTRSGTLAGTPQYMSPEQARAETVDHRSDLFSLGSVMYAMCTGHAPFRAESSYSILRLITDKEPRPIPEINSDIPEWLCTIISKLMAKQASDRFGSAQEVAGLLEDCLAHVQQPAVKKLPGSLIQHHLPVSVSPHRAGLMQRFKGLGVRSWLLAGISVAAIMLVAMMLQDNGPNPNDLKNNEAKAASDSAVVMVMHPAELRNGNTIQRAAATKTLQLLTADDYCGILGYYSASGKTDTNWLWGDGTALQKIGEDRDRMHAAIAESSMGDFPTLEPAFNMAVDAFQKANTKQKLMIVFTDGTPLFVDATLIDRFRDAGIKVSVIHVDILRIKERPLLKRLADETGGTYHYALASQANVVESLFVREVQSLRSNSNAALQKIAVAFHMFHDKVGSFPGSRMKHFDRQEHEFEHPYSWRVAILPYIGQQVLFDKYRFDEPWDSDNNRALLSEMPEFYRSPHAPRDQRPGNTNLLGFATEQGGLGLKGGEAMSSFTDGTSNTILIVETAHSVPWTKPEDLTESKVEPIVGHPLRFVLADGSVGEMNPIETDNLEKMITRNGGEVIRIEPADNPKAVDERNAHAIDHRSARSVVEACVAAALAGDRKTVQSLTRGNLQELEQLAKTIDSLILNLTKLDSLATKTVFVNSPDCPSKGIALTETLKWERLTNPGEDRIDARLRFELSRSEQRWSITEIGIEPEELADELLNNFIEDNPTAISVLPKGSTEKASGGNTKFLVLDCEEIDDLRPILGLTQLEELYINQFVYPDTDFKILEELPHLRKLTFSRWSGLSDDKIATITKSLPGVEIVEEENQVDRKNARSVVEAYIELALAGDIAKAAALSKNSPADPKQIAEIPEFLNVQRLKIQTVYVNDPAKPTRALATSAAVKLDEEHKQPDGQRDGFMVFGLELTDDKWIVIDIDFESESGAEKELQRFLEANPKSIGLPPSPKN